MLDLDYDAYEAEMDATGGWLKMPSGGLLTRGHAGKRDQAGALRLAALEMRRRGLGYREIGRRLGRAHTSILRLLKGHEGVSA